MVKAQFYTKETFLKFLEEVVHAEHEPHAREPMFYRRTRGSSVYLWTYTYVWGQWHVIYVDSKEKLNDELEGLGYTLYAGSCEPVHAP